MEQNANIVELYPIQFDNRDEMLAAGVLDASHCHLSICGRRFTRTIYRPPTGPDLLLAQFKEWTTTYDYYRELPISASFSKSSLYNVVLHNEAEITDERLLDDRHSNPGWSWANVADGISRIVDEKGFFLEEKEPETFSLKAEEAFGKLTILDWRWSHIPPPSDVHENTECLVCYEPMTYADSIRLHCRHVYHKHCFLPKLWADPNIKCLYCTKDLYL